MDSAAVVAVDVMHVAVIVGGNVRGVHVVVAVELKKVMRSISIHRHFHHRRFHRLGKRKWDKYQSDVKAYESQNAAKPDLEAQRQDIPEALKMKVCKAAGIVVIASLVEKLITERSAEIATDTNAGNRDPEDLKVLMAREEIQPEEIITCPVLKAFRPFDEEMTNFTKSSNLKGLFEGLAMDELELGTHSFYGDLPSEDLQLIAPLLEEIGVVTDGELAYEGFKTFLEDGQVKLEVGAAPANLVSSLLKVRLDSWFSGADFRTLWGQREWRQVLDGGNSDVIVKKFDKVVEEPSAVCTPAAIVEGDKKDKKDKKKDKKDKEEEHVVESNTK